MNTQRLLLLLALCAASCGGETTSETNPPAGGGQASAEEAGKPSGEQRLDTGYDLSSLRSAVPTQPVTSTTPTQPVAGPAFDGPPGHVSMAEGEETADFGDMRQGEEASHTFQLISDGDDPLVVSRFKTSCGCTVAETMLLQDDGSRVPYETGQPIPPGTRFEVKTKLKTANRQGQMATKVSIYSNDPRSVFNLNLKANVQPVLALEPVTLNFARITSADAVDGVMKVSSDVLDPFLLTVDETYITEPLTVELVAVDPDDAGRSRNWEVRVALGPSIPEGLRNYPLILSTDIPVPVPEGVVQPEGQAPRMHQLRGYVQAQVSGMVSAQPTFVTFGMVRPGQVLERSVVIECHDDFQLPEDATVTLRGLQGQEFPHADVFTTKLTKVEGANQLTLDVRLEGLGEDVNGSFAGSIEVAVAHPMKEVLVVRFSGICRPGIPGQPSPGVPGPQPGAGNDGHEGHDH
jgi:hypothetical protein